MGIIHSDFQKMTIDIGEAVDVAPAPWVSDRLFPLWIYRQDLRVKQ